MSKKRKQRVKQTAGNLNVDTRIGDVHGPDVTGIGAVVNGPCTGNQKIKTQIGTVTVGNTGLLIGAVVRGCTEDES
jgi:hypothetical protein